MGDNEQETKKTDEQTEENKPSYQDYIDQIQKLKSETVSKESYEKLKDENKKLIETLTTGASYEGGQKTEPPEEREKRITQLRNDLYGVNAGTLLNLEYVQKTLELRDALLEKGERDPFLPFGHNIIPSDADVESAERTARILKECVDYAQGDSDIFTNELQRRTIDVKIPAKSKKR